eukprot:12067807-Prorocentrum_lima.AAC.1
MWRVVQLIGVRVVVWRGVAWRGMANQGSGQPQPRNRSRVGKFVFCHCKGQPTAPHEIGRDWDICNLEEPQVARHVKVELQPRKT